ncbi:tRNA (adenosine(37)-N6)-threonylcarbamoyltransferase complex dimerization subunit type 1 TsaB [Aquimarina litoralis]|uniref:tRNA (adenosine(37)-N6)-threonylcarbamoyltransferase complex dimerization subunit type 1 TsaB n=1 Tax=Aquimarina litoralis TaxID=584605 RepID=UPI001C57251E|nr:tRNA (adenosine(37)-N6)-threonylcarbamoyltransferase complex dimerization subunit type 1 TsaB [Aquimarina litoralis]MBW1294640.1 tRNA (adenosine(37)-N6)-threonylcarbamoyltransferase complex dimerization subunit type 1 TsaB [Aquimarina litoralis]
MAYILCLETSTTNCSVALCKSGEVISLKEDYDVKYSHAERLHQFIKLVLEDAKIAFEELDAVAVSKGPGSYTGLRIGVSSAKGLCYGLGIPLISISTLHALALQLECNKGYIVPMIDARRMEVYSTIFSNDYIQERAIDAEILTSESYDTYLKNNKVYFIGNGVDKFKEICEHENAVFVLEKLPSSKEMAMLSYQKYITSDFEDVSYFEPYYLKDFIAG